MVCKPQVAAPLPVNPAINPLLTFPVLVKLRVPSKSEDEEK
jgi:hypothetical protein